MNREDLNWIDGFFREIKPYIHVREEDSLLILVPNQAHKLNAGALRIMRALFDGKSIGEILDHAPDTDEARGQIHYFFCDLRAAMRGCLREPAKQLGVEEIHFKPHINTLPVLSEIAVTYRCNLKCRFCYAGCQESQYPELETDALKKILNIIYHEAKVPSVSFTGGEPTLRDDLEELIAHACGLGMRPNLITNATLLDKERVQRLKDAGLKSAQVSLEASSASLHDLITGASGSFEKTLQGVRCLAEAGITTHTNTTLNALNTDDVQNGFLPLLKSLGMERFSMNLMIPCGSALRHHDEMRLKYSDLPPILSNIKAKARDIGMRFLWYSPTPYCIFNPIAEGLGNKSCAACDGLLSVAPDGSVLPCSSYNEPVGNLLREPFLKIWRGSRSCYFNNRKYLPAVCEPCEHKDVCSGACPLYWMAEGMDELTERQRVN